VFLSCTKIICTVLKLNFKTVQIATRNQLQHPLLLFITFVIEMTFIKETYKHSRLYTFVLILILAIRVNANTVYIPEVLISNDSITNNELLNWKNTVEEYRVNNQFDSAYISYKQYVKLRDSLYKTKRINTINNLTTKYKLVESEAQSKVLSQKLKNRTLTLILSIFLILLIILLIALSFSRYSIKSKLHKEEAKDLNLTIEQKNQELISRVLDQNHQNEIYEEINTTIATLEADKNTEKLKQYLYNINISLSNKENEGNEWQSFRTQFEQVHPQFFNNLLNIKSTLTENDLRVCAYIKLNLTTKDIANILNLSFRTIQTTRYRIKKKLGLAPETDLMKYIQSL